MAESALSVRSILADVDAYGSSRIPSAQPRRGTWHGIPVAMRPAYSVDIYCGHFPKSYTALHRCAVLRGDVMQCDGGDAQRKIQRNRQAGRDA